MNTIATTKSGTQCPECKHSTDTITKETYDTRGDGNSATVEATFCRACGRRLGSEPVARGPKTIPGI